MKVLLAALLASPLMAVAAPAPMPTVPSVDLARYAGTWYEVAVIPNRFQKQCVADTQARYTPDNGSVKVENRCRKADGEVDSIQGKAKPVEGSQNAKLKVTFFWPFKGDYWVLDIDPEYRYVLVGEPARKYGWVLSRTPQLDEATLSKLLDRAAELGYDKTAFHRTAQTKPLEP
ncbi:lipocalin family protein [Paucibacter sp. R3-3]|uniref:Outer membrane lipoprotein Blc n=1 Tax=Roseateles agri TaxID=3098619 RepID=A0ABU5DF79_9BURK|nr:lipocalin family protein [Paucibacter sp. R3-3]MDY0744804.1 lipocalin family protein [Paucibacter sp. R3-3]